MFTRTLGKVEGHAYDSDGNKILKIEGNWTTKMTIKNIESGEETVVWELQEKPENFEDMHSFSKFSINLNHLTPELEKEIAPTDSRFRPDLREFERGNIEIGGKEKHRLEEKQRDTRKKRKDEGEAWSPLWFEEVVDQDSGDKFYKINDKYWEHKKRKDWSVCPDIF